MTLFVLKHKSGCDRAQTAGCKQGDGSRGTQRGRLGISALFIEPQPLLNTYVIKRMPAINPSWLLCERRARGAVPCRSSQAFSPWKAGHSSPTGRWAPGWADASVRQPGSLTRAAECPWHSEFQKSDGGRIIFMLKTKRGETKQGFTEGMRAPAEQSSSTFTCSAFWWKRPSPGVHYSNSARVSVG